MSEPIDYVMPNKDTDDLRGITLLPHEFRAMALRKVLQERGQEAFINLFSQFIGLANSVVANGRDFLETAAIVHGDMNPYQAEKINLPTIFGALCGVQLANKVDQKRTCHGCAYRIGTMANQSPATTCDAMTVDAFNEKFMCHEGLEEAAEPKRLCAGYAQLHRDAEAIK